MKKLSVISALLALFACLSLFTACGEKEGPKAPDGMKLASGENVDYYLYVPETWKVDRSDLYTSAYFSSGDATSISATAYGVGGEVAELDSWWKGFCEEMKSVYGEVTEVETKKAKLDGVAGKEYTFTAKLGEEQYNYIVTAVVKDYYVYYITYTSTPDYYEDHLEELSKVVESFKFAE